MRKKKGLRRADILLALGVVLAALILLLVFFVGRSDGATVVVSVDGEEFGRYALWEDVSVPITQGEHSNTLVISGGQAFVEAASCPDKLCERQGKIRLQGQMIVCLPNRVVITIEGGEAAADLTIQ